MAGGAELGVTEEPTVALKWITPYADSALSAMGAALLEGREHHSQYESELKNPPTVPSDAPGTP